MSKKRIQIITIIALIGAIGIGLYLWQKIALPETSDAERKADLKKVLGRDVNETEKGLPEAENYSNDYFSLTLPAGAKKYAADNTDLESSAPGSLQKKDPLLIENMSFDLYDPRVTFVTSVRKAPAGVSKLDDISGVALRKNSPKMYSMEKITKDNNEGLLFLKKEPEFEKTVFFKVKDKIITFSETSQSYSKEAEDVFEKVIDSLTLK